MPRKRRSLSLSPQKKTSNSSIPVALLPSAALPVPPAMSGNKEEMLSNMCEMFPNLEPSLVEMVLSEYTEVETVMDYLLELSTVAKMEAKLESSGFEKITAYLDGFKMNSHSPENDNTIADKAEDCLENIDETACHDLDMLLDEALDRYGLTNPEDIYSAEQPESSVSEASTSGVMSQQVQSTSPENTSFHTEYVENIAPPQISLTGADRLRSGDSPHKSNTAVVSTTSSVEPKMTEPGKTETNCKNSPFTNDISLQNKNSVANSQRHFTNSEMPGAHKLSQGRNQPVLTAPSNVAGISSRSQIQWNPLASTFTPASSQQGSFITPIVANHIHWSYALCAGQPNRVISYNAQVPSAYVWNPFPPTHWTAENVKPVTLPKPKPQIAQKMTRLVGKVLILLRGAPGSGKSTLARMILEQNPTGIILSTDDYFYVNGQYQFDVNFLSDAHDWNHKRAKDAFEKNVSPIVIDNTNLQGWEMKPYVSMAMKYKYNVTFREPDTWWKYKPKELERRNIHGVKKEKIMKMLENFERVTVNSILNLSAAKESESAGNSELKSDERNGASNNLAKEVNLSTTEVKNPSDKDVAAVTKEKSLVSDEERTGPGISVNILESRKHYLKGTDDEPEKYSVHVQRQEDISIENQPCNIENVSAEICIEEAITNKEDNSDGGCNVSQLGEKQDLLSFVGDWPMEKTLSQRAPRNRKKAKPSSKSVQYPAEEVKTIDMVVITEPVSKEEVASVETKLEAEADVASCLEPVDLQTMGNHLHTIPAYNNDEVDESGFNSSETVQKDIQVDLNDINPDKPGKRSCRKCKLALNFSNRCSSSFGTDGMVPICGLIEAVDQSNAGISAYTQTEPHEFAIAWRVEKKNLEVFESLKILTGKVDRFKSQSLDSNEYSQVNIPYRMVHHKSTFVEEDEITSLQEDGLQILCKLFRSLSFDVLKDLFERCNKDLEWATNLLLDSGEKIYKDEYDQEEFLIEEFCENLKNDCHPEDGNIHPNGALPTDDDNSELTEGQSASLKMDDNSFKDSSGIDLEDHTLVNTFPLVVAEELKNGNVLSSAEVNEITNQCMMLDNVQPDQATVPDTIEAHIMWSSSLEGVQINSQDPTLNIDITTNNILNEKTIKKDNTQECNFPNDVMLHETGDNQGAFPTDDVEDTKNTHVLPVIAETDKPQNNSSSQPKESLKFEYLELSLPPELAFQLTELFGPVGIDPGSLTIEDCLVPIDLKLAEEIHKKWKQSIMEKHNQEALSYQLLLEAEFSTNDHLNLDSLLQEQESRLAENNLAVSQGETDMFPFMDQWNTRVKKVSLRQIMSEEMALQAREDMKKPLATTNCAVKLKEKQLLELFPNIEQNLLMDIFKENNYSLEKTEQFISSALEADPVQNVVAPGFKQEVPSSTDRTKEKRKADKEDLSERYFQDLEYPEYDDFRAEAILYQKKQQESYRKAAEAHNRGMKQVAAFYAQQGYLYGQKMKEENHRAAVQIFEQANEYLLPENILDLHGLHVDEAMKHFRKVLQDKTEDYRQNGGSPHLLVITGRGNRSQGGVPRIKPAVIDYLTNHDYRFQEKTPGALRITLK